MPKKPLSPNPYIQADHDSAFATKPLPVPFDLPKSPTSVAQNIPVKVCSVLHSAWMLMLHDEDLKGLLIQRT
ncbi:hypothetical protein RchiOBHm_Chr7g0230301 [Rosa chinensis]|uniref:Uncharacterized protein n=1 Tax=Rosa chinensis TaxID=74649 RepID=A0A2P6PFD3_ROSCH|nr:hypothetical protein RchiOBHm_Chr7g0230301 [Rosa chinensis]